MNPRARVTERSPMPAFRHGSVRRKAILDIAGIISTHWPDIANPRTLSCSPPVSEWSIAAGNGPFNGDQRLIAWSVIADDIVATQEELQEALQQVVPAHIVPAS